MPGASPVEASDDPYSDRLRCDHPDVGDPAALGEALIREARARDRGRVVVMVRAGLAPGLEAAGLETEGVMPGFYRGEEDCAVMGYWPEPDRASLADAEGVALVQRIVEAQAEVVTDNTVSLPQRRTHPAPTALATVEDAPAIAELLADTFSQYPTPSSSPEYIAHAIEGGTPFRLVREVSDVVACASADLVREARTAELTDCATRPSHRGRGLMKAILDDLIDDLRALDYPTAYTLARARVPGINLAFQRLGFVFRGTMAQSCRIGDGLEDMNIWSRSIDAPGGQEPRACSAP